MEKEIVDLKDKKKKSYERIQQTLSITEEVGIKTLEQLHVESEQLQNVKTEANKLNTSLSYTSRLQRDFSRLLCICCLSTPSVETYTRRNNNRVTFKTTPIIKSNNELMKDDSDHEVLQDIENSLDGLNRISTNMRDEVISHNYEIIEIENIMEHTTNKMDKVNVNQKTLLRKS